MYQLLQAKQEDAQNPNTVTLSGPCYVTGKEYTVKVQYPDLQKYFAGAYMQDAFPYLSADDREFLISGTSPEGWEQMFGGAE